VARRADGRPYAGYWEFPGGKILPGETPEKAAVRETAEETGLQIKPVADLGAVVNSLTGYSVVLHLVRCSVESGEATPLDEAVDEVRWVPGQELSRLQMPPVNAEIIARIQALPPGS
jgi:mutator protein MutT